MSEEPKPPPIVFISYSHDSDEHKKWVRYFATALRDIGIDVILDQWEIGPGDDVPKFMEQSVRRALRVIMVCTEQYVRKADDGKGGAGYEAMVVTGELVQDLGTRKFIPIVRQTGEKAILPVCVSTRYFVDFSNDGTFAEKLEELARNIQEAPRFEKPPLGKNPFIATTPPATPSVVADVVAPNAPIEIYELALSYANAGNFAKWRELIHHQKTSAGEAMLRWKADNQQNFPASAKDLPAFFLPAVATHSGLFAAAFGAFDSTDERFHNQLSLLDWIRKPKGWERSGNSVWVDLPELVLFTYQALLGGLALSRHRPEQAYSLATTPLSDNYSGRDAQPLFKQSRFTGWPESLAHTCTFAWVFLQKASKEWEWLWKLFGSEEDTIAAIAAYYLFLNTVDFVSATKAKTEEESELRGPKPPLFFVRGDGDIYTRSQSLFYGSANFVGAMLSENGITDEALPELWKLWMAESGKWLASVYRNHWGGYELRVPHGELPQMLFRGPNKRLIE
jgi:hypothetical protein